MILKIFGCAHSTDAGADPNGLGDAGSGSGSTGNTSSGGTGGFGTGGLAGGARGGVAQAGGSGGALAGGSGGEGAESAGGGGGTSVGETGGTSGAGATGGTSGTGATGGTTSTTGLSVRYKVGNNSTSTGVIGSELWIYNSGTEALALSELTLRYYFTNEVTMGLQKRVDWANMQTTSGTDYSGVSGTIDVVAMTTGTSTADSYTSIGFSGGATLEPGYRVQLSWTLYNSSNQSFNQSNDYSFNSGMSSETEWQNVVLMRGTSVVWGQAPQ